MMAKQRRALIPLTESEIAIVAHAATSSPVPISAKELTKQVTLSRPVTEAEVAALLETAVSAGTLFLVPGPTTKAKPLYWSQNPAVELGTAIEQAVSSSDRPLTVAELLKSISLPFKVSSPRVESELQQRVEVGHIRVFPATTSKGKARYWDRDPAALLPPRILELLAASETPLSAKDLVKQLAPTFPNPAAEVESALANLVTAGQISEIPSSKKKSPPAYWLGTRTDWGKNVVRRLVQTKGPQPEAAVRKSLGFLTEDEVGQLIQSMMDRKELYRHPPFGTVKSAQLSAHPPSPEPYLQSCAELLKSAVTTLRSANVPDEQIRRSLVQLFESTGIPFRAPASSASGPLTSSSVDLESLLKQLEPGAERGALVGIRELRRVARLPKMEFDQAVLNLSRQGRLSLHRHDFPASLTSLERDDLVQDGNGVYYVGVALRQNRQTPKST